MKAWIFPVVTLIFAVVMLSMIYFNPNLLGGPNLISPLSDGRNTPDITPTKNPLNTLSTPIPQIGTPTLSPTLVPTLAPTAIPQTSNGVSSITLTAEKVASDSAKLLWTIDGNSQSGFVVLESSATSPVFPPREGDQARSTYDPTTREFILNNLSGIVYFRVCEFTNNSCGVYSNQISLDFSPSHTPD